MSVLSGQSILKRRVLDEETHEWRPLLEPLVDRTLHVESGTTYGVGPAGYDLRIRDALTLLPGDFHLAVTMERFLVPTDLIVTIHDKSTLARMGLAVQTTVAEPGWQGWLTLELTNHGRDVIALMAGQPIAQALFHTLDEPTDRPYRGKYQNQGADPQLPLFGGDQS